MLAPIEAFAVHGETKSYVKVADSGNRRAQVFCPECGTPLYATAPENPRPSAWAACGSGINSDPSRRSK